MQQEARRRRLTRDDIALGTKMRARGASHETIAKRLSCAIRLTHKRFSGVKVDGRKDHTHTGTINRRCLKCDHEFPSTGKENRVCPKCRQTNTANGNAEGIEE